MLAQHAQRTIKANQVLRKIKEQASLNGMSPLDAMRLIEGSIDSYFTVSIDDIIQADDHELLADWLLIAAYALKAEPKEKLNGLLMGCVNGLPI